MPDVKHNDKLWVWRRRIGRATVTLSSIITFLAGKSVGSGHIPWSAGIAVVVVVVAAMMLLYIFLPKLLVRRLPTYVPAADGNPSDGSSPTHVPNAQ